MNTDGLPPWLQAGSVVVFAATIWWEQRAMRRAMEATNLMLAAMLGPDKVAKLVRRTGRALTPPPLPPTDDDDDSS